MHLRQNRVLATAAATAALLALGAAPALAGENDDGDDEDQAAPAPVVTGSSGSDTGTTISGAPEGGVATGAGGTAPQGPDEMLLALASGALVLVATGGGMLKAAQRSRA